MLRVKPAAFVSSGSAHATPPPDAPRLPAGAQWREIEPAAQQDWLRIDRHLAGHGFGLDLSVPPRRFGGGLANLNFLVRLNGGGWAVLRRPPPGPLPAGAYDMAREHRILHSLWQQLPLAPRSLHLCEDVSVAGAPFQLLEFCEGVTLRGTDLAPYAGTPETGRALSALLVDTLARIHAVDVMQVGLTDLGRPAEFLARTARNWSRRAVAVCGSGLSPATRTLVEWLERHTRGIGGDGTLLHNDFKLDNLVLDARRPEPVAILDWDMGTRGDALFDLATMLSYWTEPGDPACMHQLAQMPTASAGFFTREEAAQAYARRTGRSLAHIQVYRVTAAFKLGVVFHQLHARYLSGQDLDPRYAGFAALAEELFGFCLEIAQDKRF